MVYGICFSTRRITRSKLMLVVIHGEVPGTAQEGAVYGFGLKNIIEHT
jgi:hypothetical protein